MSELSQTIQDLPTLGMIPVGLLVVVGLVLWSAGRRVLRAGFAAVGLIIGGVAGWVLGDSLNLAVSPWVVMALLALVMACVGALVFRLAVASMLAIVCGVAAPLAVITIAELQEGDGSSASSPEIAPEEPSATDEASGWLEDHNFGEDIDIPADALDAGTEIVGQQFDISEGAMETIGEARSYGERLWEAARAHWNRTPEGLRPTIIATAVAGLLAGVLFGTLAPSLGASLVSSFGGSLIWLSGIRVLAGQMGDSIAGWMPSSATSSLAAWLIISITGVVIQWIFRPKQADKNG